MYQRPQGSRERDTAAWRVSGGNEGRPVHDVRLFVIKEVVYGIAVIRKLHIHCGAGDDTVTIAAGDNTTLKEFLIPTTIRGGGGGDTITTGNEPDLVFGGMGHNSITVGNGNDAISHRKATSHRYKAYHKAIHGGEVAASEAADY